MKHTPEKETEFTLNSLDGLQRVEIPFHLEEKIFSRWNGESKMKIPKWFRAAAVLLVICNVAVGVNYFTKNSETKSSFTISAQQKNPVGEYYFQNQNLSY